MQDLDHGPAHGVEGQNLQLDRQVDFTHIDAVRHVQHDGREVQDAGNPGRDQAVADSLRGHGGHRDRADHDAVFGHHALDLVGRAHPVARDHAAHDELVRVDQGGDPEAARSKATVVRERPAEVARAYDEHWPVLGEAEFPGYLVDQVVDVITHAPGAV